VLHQLSRRGAVFSEVEEKGKKKESRRKENALFLVHPRERGKEKAALHYGQ